MNDSDSQIGPGHNQPPPDLIDTLDVFNLIDPSIIVPLLERNFSELIAIRDDYAPGIARWIAAHTKEMPDGSRSQPEIIDDEDLKDCLDYRRQLQAFHRANTGTVDIAKRSVKECVNAAASAIEAWFSDTIKEPVRAGDAVLHAAYTRYLVQKEDQERQAAIDRATSLRQEAQRLAREAEQAPSVRSQDALMDEASEAEHRANKAAEEATATSAELTRVRGNMGTVGGLKASWTWEREDLMELLKAIVAGKESIDLITTNDRIINALVTPKAGRRTIPGLKIFQKRTGR